MSGLGEDLARILLNLPFLLAALAVAISGVMRGYSGFGTAILLAPVFSTLWGPRAGVPVLLLMELFVSAQLLPRALGEADKRMVLPLGLAAAVATPLGIWVLLHADAEGLRRAIGALVLVFGLLLLSPWRYHGPRPLGLNLAVGATGGLLKGATGMSGPPIILYLLSGPEEVRRHRANLILFFGLIAIVSVIPPMWNGLMDRDALIRAAALLPVMLACVPVGSRLFHVIPPAWYRRFAFAALMTAGGVALLG
ncbi:sulfite exporter TauE/SafE family protein [Roseomonas xinghualingensis]|uniref:sulfite exporter TauE/SafE family protein n=1 Tax=Roseomonas xinghualingensis TaxID=2986475 RepID=UPI0021F13308|nr:sulfite exporter TauE/SafE family protein [Roseomonas sp. SXEYE001]MCV4207683.1 sulfite exporter TauE/SafE family protein [Roseomonas sp. SXEYE001]